MKYQIDVIASASFSGTDYPDMILAIDGATVGSALVKSNNPGDYAFSADLDPGVAHTVSILYPNHTSSGEMLNVRSIAINGQAVSSGSSTESYVSPNGTQAGSGQTYYGINFQSINQALIGLRQA